MNNLNIFHILTDCWKPGQKNNESGITITVYLLFIIIGYNRQTPYKVYDKRQNITFMIYYCGNFYYFWNVM